MIDALLDVLLWTVAVLLAPALIVVAGCVLCVRAAMRRQLQEPRHQARGGSDVPSAR